MEEMNTSKEIRLGELWTVLKRCWILCLAVLIVVFGALYIFLNMNNVDTYRSTARVYVLSNSAEMLQNDNNMAYYMLQIADRLIEDFKELSMMEDNVLVPTLNELKNHNSVGSSVTANQLAGMIRIEQSGESRVLYITVTSSNAQASAEICNTYTKNVCSYFNSIYTDGTWQIVRVADTAKPATAPSNPVSNMLIMAVSCACALLVYAIYLIRFMMDDKINSPEDVEKHLGVSMLGMIPNRQAAARRQSKYGSSYGRQASSSNTGDRK